MEAAYQSDAVLRDSHGNPILLAARLAVVTLAGNPMACPTGVYPTWLGGTGTGCIDRLGGITDMITDTRVKTNWGVFIQSGKHTETVTITKPINLVGEYIGSMTIHGPVTFNTGNASLNSFTIVNGQVSSLPNLSGTLRLVDLLVRNPADYGIYLSAFKGAAELSNVISVGNGYGAYIDNNLGLGVAINNSDFNSSTLGYGLFVQSKGAVSLENTTAIFNKGNRADLTFGKGLVVRNSTFELNSNVNPGDSEGSGLVAVSTVGGTGGIILQNVLATQNEESGALLSARGNVAISHSYFNSNLNQIGLSVSTLGSLSVSDIQAENNGDSGVGLFSGAGGATITRSDFFSNSGIGLDLASTGSIVVDSINVNLNHSLEAGARLDNSISSAPKTALVTNSQFSQHTATGLVIYSKGNVTLGNIRSMANTGASSNGVTIDNCLKINNSTKTEKCSGQGNVTYLGANSNADVFSNGAYGLDIRSRGSVTINNFYSGYNGQAGVAINNCMKNTFSGICKGSGSVSMTHDILTKTTMAGRPSFLAAHTVLIQCAVFNNNADYGLYLTTVTGALTLKGVTLLQNNGSSLDFALNLKWGDGPLVRQASTCAY